MWLPCADAVCCAQQQDLCGCLMQQWTLHSAPHAWRCTLNCFGRHTICVRQQGVHVLP